MSVSSSGFAEAERGEEHAGVVDLSGRSHDEVGGAERPRLRRR